MRNAIPSSPFYSAINSTKNVAEVDTRTVEITLRQPNSLAANEFANLFALPANLLPPTDTPLGLLRNGGLVSSGPFTIVKFMEGSEVDLAYNTILPNGAWVNPNLVNLNGVQGQEFLGVTAGGSQIRIFSQPLTYQGQQIDNATLTTQIFNANRTEVSSQGSYFGFGVYDSTLNLNNQTLSAGSHIFTTQLYTQLSSGAIIQYGEGTLTVIPPLFVLQLIIYVAALVAVVGVVLRSGRPVAKRRVRAVSKRRRRARVSRRGSVSRPRRRR
jgi:hypothetical protein